MDPRRLHIKQDRVNTLAKRTRPVVDRNNHIPTVASIGAMVAPLADAYVAKYEALKTQRLVSRRALQAGRAEIAELHARLRVWHDVLQRELPGFERTEVSKPLSNPDGVLTNAQLLVAFVQKEGGDFAFATQLVDDVTALSERAEQAWSEGQAQLKQLQVLQSELRSIGARFLSGLGALRIALAEKLGRHDRDHRALRADPRSEDAEVEETDASEAPEPSAQQPAAASDAKQGSTA